MSVADDLGATNLTQRFAVLALIELEASGETPAKLSLFATALPTKSKPSRRRCSERPARSTSPAR